MCGGRRSVLLVANVPPTVLKRERGSRVLAVATRIRIALATCFRGKTNPSPLQVTAPAFCSPGGVLEFRLHEQSRAPGPSCFWSSACSVGFGESRRTQAARCVCIHIYMRRVQEEEDVVGFVCLCFELVSLVSVPHVKFTHQLSAWPFVFALGPSS